MMASGAPAGESEFLSLLKVISDPAGAQERLRLLSEQAEALAQKEQAFQQSSAEACARIEAAQSKSDADNAAAQRDLARANSLLSDNEARAKETAALVEQLRQQKEMFAAEENAKRAGLDARETDLAEREKSIAGREAGIAQAQERARSDAEAAALLKREFEEKLAQLRAITG